MSQNEHDETGAGMSAQARMDAAKNEENELVIRCTTAKGERFDFLAYHLHGVDDCIWLMVGDQFGKATEAQPAGVRNMMHACEPDVELVHESDSLFGVQ